MSTTFCRWPLYDAVVACFEAAGRIPPTRPELARIEIAEEDKAIELIGQIKSSVKTKRSDKIARARATVLCIEQILDALHEYRNFRDLTARPSPDRLQKLRKCRNEDLPRTFERLIKDPEHKREILSQLLLGARSEGVIEDVTENGVWKARVVSGEARGPWLHGEIAWALALAAKPELFQRAIKRTAITGPTKSKSIDLVRRLRDLANKPTCRKFDRLIADAQEVDSDGLDTLISALRYAASRTVFRAQDLPDDWLSQIKVDTKSISLVAKTAHAWLRRGLDGQGRTPSSTDLERYAGQVANAYQALTGKPIGYARATGNARSRKAGESYGEGLDFMRLALQLIDGAADDNQTRSQIDKIRR